MATQTKIPEEQRHMAMIDLAHEILKTEKQPLPFQNIVDQVKDVKPPAKEEYEEQIARLYTNLNLDGRFLSIGENHWGLRSWYPFDQKPEDVEIPKPKSKPQPKKQNGSKSKKTAGNKQDNDEQAEKDGVNLDEAEDKEASPKKDPKD